MRPSTPVKFDESTFPSYLTDKRMVAGERQQAPKNLRSLHHEILRLTLLGWKGSAVAKYLGISQVTVSNCLASPKARGVLMMLQQARTERSVDIAEDMRHFAPTAFNVVKEIVTDEAVQPSVRLRGADLALGLAGFVKPQRIQSTSIHTHLTMDEINELKTRARAAAAASGVLALPEETGTTIDLEVRSGSMESAGVLAESDSVYEYVPVESDETESAVEASNYTNNT